MVLCSFLKRGTSSLNFCNKLSHHCPIPQAARNLIRKIQKGELHDQFDNRDIYRKHWTLLKTKEEVESACSLLVENGWLREGTVSEGRKTKGCYFINPSVKKGDNHE